MCSFDYFNWGSALLSSGLIVLVLRLFMMFTRPDLIPTSQVLLKNLLSTAIIILVVGLILMTISATVTAC